MVRRALVIGSQTGGLSGPYADARRIAEELRRWEFEDIDLRADKKKTSRAGILQGYRDLAAKTKAGDAVAIFYSGHGVRVAPASGTAVPAGARRAYQSIVPSDFDASAEGDFRGIVDVELSVLLAQLTAVTDNVTVLLDCCHAQGMSRRLGVRPKSLVRDSFTDLAAHVARVTAAGLAVDLLQPTGNESAVRVVATPATQLAFEIVNDQGEPIGALTEALLAGLAMSRGQRVTWEALEGFLRERLAASDLNQRPDVEGPRRRRYLFETEEAPRRTFYSIARGDSLTKATLRAGRIHGVRVGDEYDLYSTTVVEPKKELRLGKAVVTSAGPVAAVTKVTLGPTTALLPPEAKAFPTISAAPRPPVVVTADEAERAAIVAAIDAAARFTIAPSDSGERPIAEVRLQGETLSLFYPSGERMVDDSKYSKEALAHAVDNLRVLLAANQVLQLASDGLPDAALDVEWGLVDAGKAKPLGQTGAAASVGDSFYVRVTNRHPLKKTLHVAVLDVGVGKRIQLLTSDWPSGVEVAPGETFTLGQTVNRDLEGIELGWADGVPDDQPRPETLVVVACEQPARLAALETPGMSGWGPQSRKRKGGESSLEALVRQMQHGASRDAAPREKVAYAVQQASFLLKPPAAPAPDVPA